MWLYTCGHMRVFREGKRNLPTPYEGMTNYKRFNIPMNISNNNNNRLYRMETKRFVLPQTHFL